MSEEVESVQVQAIATGLYKSQVREPGAVFSVPKGFKGSWFVPVEERDVTVRKLVPVQPQGAAPAVGPGQKIRPIDEGGRPIKRDGSDLT